ncbi:hypothetical protein KAR91_57685 [Candidatus Pacearchaeota archaeon]|nr:hypothetical protein [Candidatus Pacearchaeota archaeon]
MWYIPIWPTWFITLDNIIQLSPVPVRFVNDILSGSNGFYSHNENFDFDANHHIGIKDDLKDYQKIAVLIHEIGHAKCDKKNCDCMKNPNHKYREIHAYMYELKWLLKHNQREGLNWIVNKLIDIANWEPGYYTEAAKHIMKTKLWQKCLRYIGKL